MHSDVLHVDYNDSGVSGCKLPIIRWPVCIFFHYRNPDEIDQKNGYTPSALRRQRIYDFDRLTTLHLKK